MEIYSFEDLLQRVSEIQIRGSDPTSVAVFNDYISTNSIIELIKHQKEIDKIKVVREDFFTGEKTPYTVSIILNEENTTFFIMAEKKISYSAPFTRFWFGKKTEACTDYLYCYPQNYRETMLTRTDKDTTTIIYIKKSHRGEHGCIFYGFTYKSQTKERIKLDENSIREIAMKIFDNAVVSMNTFCSIEQNYEEQLKSDPRENL